MKLINKPSYDIRLTHEELEALTKLLGSLGKSEHEAADVDPDLGYSIYSDLDDIFYDRTAV